MEAFSFMRFHTSPSLLFYFFVVMLGCLDFVVFCVNGRKVPRWLGITILSIIFYEDFGIVITIQHRTYVSKFEYGMTNRNVSAIRSGKRYCNNIILSKRFINGYLLRW
jgi:hypothetical protein